MPKNIIYDYDIETLPEDSERWSVCPNRDCQINHEGKCYSIKWRAKTKDGVNHYIFHDSCPFYQKRIN